MSVSYSNCALNISLRELKFLFNVSVKLVLTLNETDLRLDYYNNPSVFVRRCNSDVFCLYYIVLAHFCPYGIIVST